MLATDRFYVHYGWRRERDSFSARSNGISNLLILQEAHQAQTAFRDHGTHESHTARRWA